MSIITEPYKYRRLDLHDSIELLLSRMQHHLLETIFCTDKYDQVSRTSAYIPETNQSLKLLGNTFC